MRLFFPLGSVRGVPLRVHATALLGGVAFGQLTLRGTAAWLVVCATHACGHVLFLRGTRPAAITLHAVGVDLQRVRNAGGVAAQGLLALAIFALNKWTNVELTLGRPAFDVLTTFNVWMLLVNLLPVAGLDGEALWRTSTSGQPAKAPTKQWEESLAFKRKIEELKRTPGPYRKRPGEDRVLRSDEPAESDGDEE